MFRGLAVAVAIGLSSPMAHAGCTTPVSGSSAARTEWRDVETFAPTAANPAVENVQRLSEGSGPLNLDYYAITIDSGGQSAAALASELRQNFNRIVFDGADGQSFRPYDDANAIVWASASPRDALMTFVLATGPFDTEIEKGSVSVSCATATDWIFTTVESSQDGLHPVSGNRGFGVVTNIDGSLTIYTKAADRATNAAFYALGVLDEGESVWTRMLANLAVRYRSRNPRKSTSFSRRV